MSVEADPGLWRQAMSWLWGLLVPLIGRTPKHDSR